MRVSLYYLLDPVKQRVHGFLIKENKARVGGLAGDALEVKFWILLPVEGVGLIRLSSWNGW